jgi:hypothetical protein
VICISSHVSQSPCDPHLYKFDALDAITFTNLECEGKTIEAGEAEAPQHAEEEFEKQELPWFMDHIYCPNGIIYLCSVWSFSF